MSPLSKVTAVLVLYDVTEVIFDCLNNLINIKIIIVDNGNNNLNIINKIKNEYVLEKYFKTKKNIGFGRANNLGFKYVKTQYTLLIEPDVIINELNIVNLIKTLEATEKWNFTFLGADIDAIHTSKMLNIRRENVVSFSKTYMPEMMNDVSEAMRQYSVSKSNGSIKKDFLDFIINKDRRK
jgi:GT2 family glycosyltransferase